MKKFTITAIPPFSLGAVIRSHGWHQLAPFQSNEDASLLTYTDRLSNGKVVSLQISAVKEGVVVVSDSWLSQQEKKEVQVKVCWMLGLKQIFSAFYDLANQEPKLSQVEKRCQGRILRAPTLFEDVIKTLLTTNTAWGGTKRMVSNLVDQFGDAAPNDSTRHAFPTPERLAAASEPILRNQTRLGYRSPYVLELAQRVASGELALEGYKTHNLPTLELRKELLAIKGIGSYAAANLLMILGRYDYLPVDSWALKMVSHEWYHDQAIGPTEVEQAFEKWGEWKGLAYWFWDWSAT